MLRNLLFLALFSFSLNAEIIGGVAIRVNGMAITLQEIQNMMKLSKLPKNQVIDILIEDRLKQDEINKMGIVVDEFRIDEEISKIAQNNGITKDQLISSVAREGLSYTQYRIELKKQIENAELMQRVLSQSVGVIDQKELQTYYQRYKEEYVLPSKISVTRYLSSDQTLLQEALRRPKDQIAGVEKLNETINLKDLSPQVAQVFFSTKVGGFTPILNSGSNAYITFYVKEHLEPRQLSFEESKNAIQQKIMMEKEQVLLREYFAKLKDSAKIIYIR